MSLLEKIIRKELKNYNMTLTEIDFEVSNEIKSILKNVVYTENGRKCASIDILPYVFRLNSSETYIISLEYNNGGDDDFSTFRDVFINLNLNKIAFTSIDDCDDFCFSPVDLFITELGIGMGNLLEKELKDLFVTLEMIY